MHPFHPTLLPMISAEPRGRVVSAAAVLMSLSILHMAPVPVGGWYNALCLDAARKKFSDGRLQCFHAAKGNELTSCWGAVSSGRQVKKTSRRDLALVMAKGLDGATTVSATMLLAHRAGIHVFVTGGVSTYAEQPCCTSTFAVLCLHVAQASRADS